MSNNSPIWTKRFISLFFSNITIFIVFYGLVTTLPLYAKNILSKSDEEAGLLLSIFLLSAIIVRPFSGKLLDIFNKKKLLIFSLTLYLICTILYLFIEPFWLLLLLRFFQGIWFSITTTATGSIAADIVPPERRGTGLGYFVMSTNLAVVLGPLVGLFIIQHFDFQHLFIILSIFAFLGAVTALSIKYEPIVTAEPTEKHFRFSLNDLFERKAIPVAFVASIVSFAYASVLSFLSIYAEEKGLISIATWFFAVYAAAMLISRPFTGKLYDSKGPHYVIIPGFICFAAGLVVLAFVTGPILFLLSGALIGLGYGALVPSFQTKAVQSTSNKRSSYATATFFTLFDVGIAIGSFVLGIIATAFGYENLFIFSACISLIAFVFYLLLSKKKSKSYK